MSFFIISFLLYGKFASWRDPANITTAKSYLYPSNTNIIGILGAALGISNEEKMIEIQKKLFGIGVEGIFNKKTFSDKRLFLERLYNLSNLESNRIRTIQTWEYIFNPMYKIYIIIKQEQKDFVQKIRYHLENPEYPIYLGRSEFIGRIENIEIIHKESLERIKKIRNTHVNIEIIPQNGTIIYITRKLKRYNTNKKLYDSKQLETYYEIIGNALLKEELLGIGEIPIIHLFES